MTGWLNLGWMLLMVALLTWLAAIAIVPLVLRFVACDSLPSERRQLWLVAAIPWLLPLASVTGIVGLATAKQLGWFEDHCLYHVPEHPHFCFEHLPQILLGAAHSFAGISVLAAIAGLFAWYAFDKFRQSRRIHALSILTPGFGPLRRIDDSRALAFAGGLCKPNVFLSNSIKSVLNKRQQRIVVAHEVAHIRHLDVVKNMLFDLLLLLHIAPQGLRRRWRLNTEVRADKRAAERYSSLDVAEVLLILTRASYRSSSLTSIVGADPQQRIDRLLSAQKPGGRFMLDGLFWSSMAVLTLSFAVYHHTLETLLGWLLGL